MGRKAKRLKVLKRIERLTAKADQPIPVVSNSEMQEKMKEQKVDVAPDTNFNAEIVEKLIEEAIASLTSFGSRAANLEALTHYVLNRNH